MTHQSRPTPVLPVIRTHGQSPGMSPPWSASSPTEFERQWQAIADLHRKELFFIGGFNKSGTTWLQVMLNAHPDIVCGGEGHFFDSLAPVLLKAVEQHNALIRRKNATVLRELPPYPCFGDAELRYLMVAAITMMLARSCDGRQVRLVGEKTPDNVSRFPVLEELFPGAKFLHLVRDGRDCLVSSWFHNLRVNRTDTMRDYGTIGHFVEHFAAAWASELAAGLGFCAARPDRCLTIRYEDLCHGQTETLAQVFRFLGVDAGEDVVRACVEDSAFEVMSGGRQPGEEDRNSLMRRGLPGNWRDHLEDDVVQRFMAEAGDVMRQLGYAADAPA